MSWRKPRRVEDVILYPGSMEVEEYVYTPGVHGLEYAKALKQGKILGMHCPKSDLYIVPPLTYCPDGEEGELVEVDAVWRIAYYTVIMRDMEGNLVEPEIIALIRPDGFAGGIIHRVKADPDSIYTGMPVRPVFAPEDQRTGNINDILYWEPIEE